MKNLNGLFLVLALGLMMGSCKKDEGMPILAPEAAFTMDKSMVEVGESIQFTNQSENADSYAWDFGDGNTSTTEDPNHVYASSGVYTVKLTATGEGGINATSKTVTVIDADPVADFNIDMTIAGVGELVTFTNNSLNAMDYEWDFGDGNVSTDVNPTHTYDAVGVYTVKLTAKNNDLEDSVEKTIEVVIPVNIYPGEKIKGINLGEIWGAVKDMPGYDFIELGPILIGGNWFHPVEEESMGILFFLLGTGPTKSDSDQVVLISAESPFIGTTEEGIGLGSTLSEVQAAYGTPSEISGNNHRYTNLGIDFTIEASAVTSVTIYLP